MVPLVRELETDMLRTALAALVLTGVFSTTAPAFEIDQMADQERAIFRSEVRDYLLQRAAACTLQFAHRALHIEGIAEAGVHVDD